MCLERRANLFLSLHQNITRILRVQLTLVKQMCSSKVLASPVHSRPQFLLDLNCLTPKANSEDLDAFDTSMVNGFRSTWDAQNLDACDSLPKILPRISAGQLVEV